MPVYRDVLAWDVFELGIMNRPLLPFLVRQVRYLMVSALIEAMWIHCRWLNLTQLTTWESAATVLSFFVTLAGCW
jgi:hypothetical protein